MPLPEILAPLVCNACALPSTARSPFLSACREHEKSEPFHIISFPGNFLCSDTEGDGAAPKAPQIMLGARQEALRDTRHSPRQRSAHLSWIQTPAGAGVLPACLPVKAVEEVKSELWAEVAWQDKSDMALAAAQGGWFWLCPLPPAQPVPASLRA